MAILKPGSNLGMSFSDARGKLAIALADKALAKCFSNLRYSVTTGFDRASHCLLLIDSVSVSLWAEDFQEQKSLS